jgi:hypothetical protein
VTDPFHAEEPSSNLHLPPPNLPPPSHLLPTPNLPCPSHLLPPPNLLPAPDSDDTSIQNRADMSDFIPMENDPLTGQRTRSKGKGKATT